MTPRPPFSPVAARAVSRCDRLTPSREMRPPPPAESVDRIDFQIRNLRLACAALFATNMLIATAERLSALWP